MKDVKKVKKVVEEEEIVDITCDICMKSCKDSMDMNYENLTIKGNWGYGSDKDGESWEAHICEKCSTEYLDNLILFHKTSYITRNKDLNKVNVRKKKIREAIGVKVNIEIDKE